MEHGDFDIDHVDKLKEMLYENCIRHIFPCADYIGRDRAYSEGEIASND